MTTSIEMPTACDLSETSLNEAAVRYLGGARLSDCTLYACIYHRAVACRLQGIHGFQLVLVPPELMNLRTDTWLLECGGNRAWSFGVLF